MSLVYQRLLVTASAIASKLLQSPLWVFVFILGGLTLIGIPNAKAAFVTTNEAGLDSVFSQSSFGSNTIDIRFNPTVTIENANLLNIDSNNKLNTLFNSNSTASNIISIFYVDNLSACGSISPSFIGCADFPGNKIVVESSAAADGVFGTTLLGHEIGHNLNLDHVNGNNLMNAFASASSNLTPAQVMAILTSFLIQFDDDGTTRFIQITPVLVTPLVTPLPPAGIMFVSALIALFGIGRRKKN